ncbi:hypothetical protein KO500_13600 [Cellulophaga baltica]|uniref:hypothetical protein n=1 Tax=Cellulophaga TaxID=104264 RepID=UPI001C06F800|nr:MULTISPECIES: hypothetical protein [Cellulophaga]MBU2997478.1 hypothetical protein [Cellulophaga baltica]MDO6768875.1 hypothetical protein [Cellulophaga sp. 1_MG-2023]
MIEDIKKFKTNWIDGMKISKEHFQNLQDFAEHSVRDLTSIQIGKNGYGLLASHLSDHNEYTVTIDAHKSLKISIKKLRGITPNGTRVEITNQTPAVKEDVVVEEFADNNLEEGFVLLNVDHVENVAFGEQDPKEMPPRYPFTTNKYFFSFVNVNEFEKSGIAGNQLPIAKIVRENNGLVAASDYIAPSTTLGTSEALIDFYNVAESFLKMAERSSILIVQKINTKQSDNPIADAMFTVVDKLYVYLSQQITYVKWEEYDMAPKKLLEIIVSFSRIFKSAVDVASPENKEQLFNYFGEWTDLKGGDYEKIFTNIINIDYKHNDINQNLIIINSFMSVIERLFTILTQVDYIGKRRDMGIFVNENIVQDKSGKSGGTSFLAE